MSFLKFNDVEFADPLTDLAVGKKATLEKSTNANGRTIASVVNRATYTLENLSWGSLTQAGLNMLTGLVNDGTATITLHGENFLALVTEVEYAYLWYTDDDDVMYGDVVLSVTDMGYSDD